MKFNQKFCWLVSTRTYLIILLIYAIGQLGWWIMDTRTPIKSTSISTTDISNKSTVVDIDFPVRYTNLNSCSILVSIYLIDKDGRYVDIMATRYLDESGLRTLIKADSHNLKFALVIPSYIKTPARLYAQLLSMCNPVQVVWPLATLISADIIRTVP